MDGLGTEFVLLIMTGREASETDAKLKGKNLKKRKQKGLMNVLYLQ